MMLKWLAGKWKYLAVLPRDNCITIYDIPFYESLPKSLRYCREGAISTLLFEPKYVLPNFRKTDQHNIIKHINMTL